MAPQMRKGQPGEEKEGSAGAPCVQDGGGKKLAGVWKLGANEKSSGQLADSCREPLDAKRFQGQKTVAEGTAFIRWQL